MSAWDWLVQSFACGLGIGLFIALPYILHWGE